MQRLSNKNEDLINILRQFYYRPEGYYQSAKKLQKIVQQAGYDITFHDIKKWLYNQAIFQLYRSPLRYICRASFNKISQPNVVHQCDLLKLSHDVVNGKIYIWCLTIIDIASRYKGAFELTSKNSSEVANAFEKIYNDPLSLLTWPRLLQCDGGREFRGTVAVLMGQHNVTIRVADIYSHRSQSLVERFNRTLAEKLYRSQYAMEFLLPNGERSRTWVRALPYVINELNNSVTRLIGMKPIDAIKLHKVIAKPSLPVKRPIGSEEPQLPMDITVRYLLAPGELEGGDRRRATDPIWSPQLYSLKKIICSHNQPILYYLENGPRHAFVREELMPVNKDLLELPPQNVLSNNPNLLRDLRINSSGSTS